MTKANYCTILSPMRITKAMTVEAEDYELFQKMYPRLISLFTRKALHKAVRDKEFFDSVFFGVSLPDVPDNHPF